MRTKKEIDKKIKELQAERKKLPEFSMFDDANWSLIDRQVAQLKQCKDLHPGEIRNKLDSMLDEYDGEFPDNPIDKARVDVWDWLLGNVDEF